MALGVTACTHDIHAGFVHDDKMKTFFHGHSFTANPITCTAALANLDLFEKENTPQKIANITSWHSAFKERISSISSIHNVRLCGTVIALEVEADVSGYTSSVRDKITEEGLKRGVYLRPLGNTVYLMPPYCVSKSEMEMVYRVLEEVVTGL